MSVQHHCWSCLCKLLNGWPRCQPPTHAAVRAALPGSVHGFSNSGCSAGPLRRWSSDEAGLAMQDDGARFQRPITSLRLFSPSRLSFGTQLYG